MTFRVQALTYICRLGPRKLQRKISAAADLSTPVTLQVHALHNRAGPQTPLANLRKERRGGEPSTDYFSAQTDRCPKSQEDHEDPSKRSESSSNLPTRQTSDVAENSDGSERGKSPASPAVMTPSVLAEQGEARYNGQSGTNSTVLLVEDNDVNMKVSPIHEKNPPSLAHPDNPR